GSSITSLCPSSQGASRRARGTRVVLPAPGGAWRTAAGCCASASRRAGRTGSMGRVEGMGNERAQGGGEVPVALTVSSFVLRHSYGRCVLASPSFALVPMLAVTAARREGRATLTLAVPLVLTQLTQMTMSFVDVIMIGRLGTAALAGGVLGSSTFFTLLLVCVGVVLAVNPSVAQSYGAGDDAEVGRWARQGLWLGLLLGVPLIVLLGYGEAILLA